jgi:hypothetical protein
MLTKPRGRRASRRSSKLNMESGTFVLQVPSRARPYTCTENAVPRTHSTRSWFWADSPRRAEPSCSLTHSTRS